MSLPDKSTKHIPKPQAPIGAVHHNKLKVIDGRTGNVGWRQGGTGFLKDFDGDPIAQNHNAAGLKKRPEHHSKMGDKQRHKPYMGTRPTHQAGQASEDSE